MSTTVCIFTAGTLSYSNGGGYLWVYLNWALGLRALGYRVIWLEGMDPLASSDDTRRKVAVLKSRLEPYGLGDSVALCSWAGEPLPAELTDGCLGLDEATEADLLLNQQYGAPYQLLDRFRRTALLDIDPGLLQTWMSKGWVRVAPHDAYFTISETVAQGNAHIPDVGIQWQHSPPCVALDWWPVSQAADDAAFTTVAHWYATAGVHDTDEAYSDDKRSGFLPFLGLPRRTACPLELALDVAGGSDYERMILEEQGWRVKDAYQVAPTPAEYQQYIQGSLGEFSCAKPSYVRLQTAWISDRTVCYLASGKPVVVQHTGPSQSLPDSAGLFRFRDIAEAARCLDTVMADYDQQSSLARTLAEQLFDAPKVMGSLLERALT